MELKKRHLLKLILALASAGVSVRAAAMAALTYWHHLTSEAELSGLEEIIGLFRVAYPEIDVRSDDVPNSSYMQKVSMALLAEALPDCIMVTADRFSDLLAMAALKDITGLVNAWPDKADLPPDRWTGFSREGKLYAVPAFAFVDWMYYRKDLFEEAEISDPPKTFDEFVAVGRKLTDLSKGRYGFGMRGGAGGFKYVIDMIQAFGSPIVRNGQPAIDRSAAIAAVDFYSGLLIKEKIVPPSAPGDSYSQTMGAFRAGQTAMVWHHTGSLKEVSSSLEPNVQFATAVIPAGPKAHIARVAYAANAITAKGDVASAWPWISFWSTRTAAIALLEATGYFPASQRVLEDPLLKNNPIYSAAIEAMSFGSLPNDFVGSAGWSQSVVDPAFQSVLVGQATPAQAVDRMISGLEKQMH
jgi:multiple sugar transport system substrate-binding protein